MKYSNAEGALQIRNVSLSDPCVKPSQKRNPKISQQKVLAINPGWKRELNLPPAAGSRKKGTMRKRDKGGFGFHPLDLSVNLALSECRTLCKASGIQRKHPVLLFRLRLSYSLFV